MERYKIQLFFKMMVMSASSSWALQSVVDFGFQYIFLPFLKAQLYRPLNRFVFTGLGCQPNAQPPTWRTRVSLLVWNLTLDLSDLGDPASSYATAGIAFEITGLYSPSLYYIVSLLIAPAWTELLRWVLLTAVTLPNPLPSQVFSHSLLHKIADLIKQKSFL
jgi:hypothetical protein